MLTAEQIAAANKTSFETFFGLTTKAFEGVEKIVELNIAASKALLNESVGHAKEALSVKDVKGLLAVQTGIFQPMAEKTTTYSRHLYEIASATGAEFSKACEEQIADAKQKFMTLVETASKNAPAGSEAVVTAIKSAVTAADNAYESAQKIAKQATEIAESNFKAAANTAVNASKSVVAGAKKR